MGETAFDRAFNKALSNKNLEVEQIISKRPLSDAEKEAKEQAALRSESAPMSVDDAIKRMLLADKDKDSFRYFCTVSTPYRLRLIFDKGSSTSRSVPQALEVK